MEYSGRVNSRQGGGGVAGTAETNVQTRQRIKELLSTQVLDLENDPYVIRGHSGTLSCKLCATTHTNEASYISHLGGKKHHLNLQYRRQLDEKAQRRGVTALLSFLSVPKRSWTKIGRPAFTATKIRHPDTLQKGVLVVVKYPKATVEPTFRVMSRYELLAKQQGQFGETYGENNQYLVVLAEPYDNICVIIPDFDVDTKSFDEKSDTYWWHWDQHTKEYYIQFFFKDK